MRTASTTVEAVDLDETPEDLRESVLTDVSEFEGPNDAVFRLSELFGEDAALDILV